jgi:hypothetical protein
MALYVGERKIKIIKILTLPIQAYAAAKPIHLDLRLQVLQLAKGVFMAPTDGQVKH